MLLMGEKGRMSQHVAAGGEDAHCSLLTLPLLKLRITSSRGSLSISEQVQKGISLNTASKQNHAWSLRVRTLSPLLSPLNEL